MKICKCRDEEVAAVARLQAQAFHESSAFAPLDSLLYYVFQARSPPTVLLYFTKNATLCCQGRRCYACCGDSRALELCSVSVSHGNVTKQCSRECMATRAVQGEVLSGLQQKMKYSHKDGFCCLVASAASDPDTIVGVVEVSLQGEKVCVCVPRSRQPI